MKLIALYLVKTDSGIAKPGESFDGDESLIADGLAMPDMTPEDAVLLEAEQAAAAKTTRRGNKD